LGLSNKCFDFKSQNFKADFLSSQLSYRLPIVCKIIRRSKHIFFVNIVCRSVDALNAGPSMHQILEIPVYFLKNICCLFWSRSNFGNFKI